MTTRALTLLAALLLLARPSPAQEAKVLQEDWSVRWVGGKKALWTDERIEEAGGGHLRYVSRSWRPLGPDRVIVSSELVETDGAGKVLRMATSEDGPWGATKVSVEGDATGLVYRVEVRSLPVIGGRLEGDVWSPTIVTYLVMKGLQPPGKRTLRALALPGEGAKERELEVRRDGERWREEGKAGVSWYDASGRFLRTEPKDRLAELVVVAASAEEARDLEAAPPADAPAGRDEVETGGVRVRRPTGTGWSIASQEDERGMRMVGLEHAAGLGALVMVMPMRLPNDEKLRLRVAETLRGSINAKAKDARDGPELGAPAAGTWRDRPALRFDVGGTMGMAPVQGDAFLLTIEGATFMVLEAWPKDLTATCKAEIEQAAAALELAGPPKAEWERVQLPGASLEVPRGWKAKAEGERISPLGASRVKVSHDAVPAGVDLRQAQTAWANMNKQNPAIEEFELVREDDVQVGGQEAHVVEWRGRLKETNGVAPRVRSCSCIAVLEDGTFVEVVVVGFDMDFDLAGLDRVLGSVQWQEAAAIEPH